MNTQSRRIVLLIVTTILLSFLLLGCTVTMGPPGGGGNDEQEQHKVETIVAGTVQAQTNQTATAMAGTTPTDAPATDTPEPQPTDTPAPPTDTPVPATDTPAPPTNTPAPPTNTPVPQQPDLQVDWIKLNPNPPIQGEPVNVELHVYNHGNARANGHFIVGWWPGANYPNAQCTWNIDGLNAHGGRVLHCTYAGYPSWYAHLDTMARTDTDNAIAESNEDNNELRMTISVSKPTPTPTPPPAQANLKVDWIEFNPDPPVQGESLQVKLQVYNHGNARANGTFRVEWWAGVNFVDGPHCTWNINGMNAHGGRVLQCTYSGYKSWYGNLETKAVADVNNVIPESNEADNELHMNISVAKP